MRATMPPKGPPDLFTSSRNDCGLEVRIYAHTRHFPPEYDGFGRDIDEWDRHIDRIRLAMGSHPANKSEPDLGKAASEFCFFILHLLVVVVVAVVPAVVAVPSRPTIAPWLAEVRR